MQLNCTNKFHTVEKEAYINISYNCLVPNIWKIFYIGVQTNIK